MSSRIDNKMFQDKVVVVTGAASGIGKALARAFANAGAVVVATDLLDSQTVVNSLREPQRHMAVRCNVAKEYQVQSMIEQVKRRYGRIDIYCSNAGINILDLHQLGSDSVTQQSMEQWREILNVNLLSHVFALKALLPDWERGIGDRHFCITASAGGFGAVGNTSYAVTKAAAISLAEHLAIMHEKIKVHCLCPALTSTPMVKPWLDDPSQKFRKGDVLTPEFVADLTLQRIAQNDFFIFPHPKIPKYILFKAKHHAQWLKRMQTFRQRMKQASKL